EGATADECDARDKRESRPPQPAPERAEAAAPLLVRVVAARPEVQILVPGAADLDDRIPRPAGRHRQVVVDPGAAAKERRSEYVHAEGCDRVPGLDPVPAVPPAAGEDDRAREDDQADRRGRRRQTPIP